MKKYPFQDSALPLKTRVADLMSRLTLEEKTGLLPSRNQPVERLGVKLCNIGTEVARGFVGRTKEEYSTVFPQPIGLAGTFDTELMSQLGEIAAAETRINKHKNPNISLMTWGPTVDMLRDPRWGRNEEAYGEDPFLTGAMTTAYTKAMRGGKPDFMTTVPTLKHFCADNNEETRMDCSASMNDRLKHEYYYAAFRPSITAGGAYSVMAAYNELCGIPMLCNPDLDKVLKKQWGLGLVVSDGGDFAQNVTAHKICGSHAESLALALKAGADVMSDDPELVRTAAKEALDMGFIDESDIDRAVYATLKTRFMTGEFDDGFPLCGISPDKLDCAEYRKTNKRAADENVVLLKNDGILPLKTGGKVAVLGYSADCLMMDWYTGYASYGYTIKDGMERIFGEENVLFDDTNDRLAIRSVKTGKYLKARKNGEIKADGDKITAAAEFMREAWSEDETTLKSALNGKYVFVSGKAEAVSESTFRWFCDETLRPEEAFGHTIYKTRRRMGLAVNEDGEIVPTKNTRTTAEFLFDEELVSGGIQRAAEIAAKCDTAVVCVGNNPMFVARECYDRKHLELSEHDRQLIKAVYEANPNTVVVLVSSYPYALNYEKESIPAILYTSHAGAELGTAVADVLCGNYNPAGRLAQTWYKSAAELPDIEDYDIAANKMTYLYYDGEPLFPFGYGLSYSSFRYGALKASVRKDAVQLTLNVKNTSCTDGDEVVQIYFRMDGSAAARPIKKLCAFRRVHIKAGETEKLTLSVPLSELAVYDMTAEKLVLEGGRYTFMAGASSEDIRCECCAEVVAPPLPCRNLNMLTQAKAFDESTNARICYSWRGGVHYVRQTHWETRLTYANARLDGCTKLMYAASTTAGAGSIRVYIDGAPVGESKICVTQSPEHFINGELEIKKAADGVHTVTIELAHDTNLKSFRFV